MDYFNYMSLRILVYAILIIGCFITSYFIGKRWQKKKKMNTEDADIKNLKK